MYANPSMEMSTLIRAQFKTSLHACFEPEAHFDKLFLPVNLMELQYLQIYRFVYLQNIKSQNKCRITSIGGQMVFVRAFCRFFGHIAVSRCSPLLAGTFGSPGSSSKTVVTKQGKRLHKQLGQEETTNKKLKLF